MLFAFTAALLTLCAPSLPQPAPAAATRPAPPSAPAPAVRKSGVVIKTGRCDMARPFHFPAQRFDETAQAIAHATGCFIQYDDQALAAVKVNPINGTLTLRQALRVALRGTKLGIIQESADRLVVASVAVK